MKLIYAKGACSLSVHILLNELDIPHEDVRVSLEDKTVLDSYNPRSYVPVLVLNDGTVMTEAISILHYISSTNGGAFYPDDYILQAKCLEWLVFLSTEIHKGLMPYFNPDKLDPDFLEESKEKFEGRLRILDEQLAEGRYIMGSEYTIADMYALALLRIGDHVKVSYEAFPNITRYKEELEDREVISKVIAHEEKAELATEPRTFTNRNETNYGSQKSF